MEITQELLDKYYLGRCSTEEREAVESWLKEEDTTETSLPVHIDLQALENREWASFQAAHPEAASIGRSRSWLTRRQIVLAASLVLASSFFLYFYLHTNPKPKAAAYLSYTAGPGKKATLNLADGTRVHLNSGSTLRYPIQFNDSIRLLKLTGEAFIEVAKDPAKPFVVETARSVTRVLGTAFDLREYPDEGRTSVVVSEGKVAFSAKSNSSQQVMLTANRMGWIKPGNEVRELAANARDHMAWKENKLIFNDMTLEEISHTLERWYGVEMNMAPALVHQRYTGQFDNPALPAVLKSLAFAIRFNYEIQGHNVIITP